MKIYELYFNLNPLAIVQSLQKSPGVRRTVIYERLKKFVEIHECTRINNRLKVSLHSKDATLIPNCRTRDILSKITFIKFHYISHTS